MMVTVREFIEMNEEDQFAALAEMSQEDIDRFELSLLRFEENRRMDVMIRLMRDRNGGAR